MDKLVIRGGNRLHGVVTVDGAKNAILPALSATLLTDQTCVLRGVPKLQDVYTMVEVLANLGCSVRSDNCSLTIDAGAVKHYQAPYELVRQMRASFLVAGPLLARFGRASMALPGGCAIGPRPIDLHLKGFFAMGARVSLDNGRIELTANSLRGATVYLDFPSVGATENLMMAASLAKGITYIENAAEEPEVVDLANMINSMGGRVSGAGTKTIRIEGVESLKGTTHEVIPDRAEAATFMIAAAVTGGDVVLKNVIPDHLKAVSAKLREAGVSVEEDGSLIHVRGDKILKAVDVKTMPYPGFPTDLQAPMMSLLAVCEGTSLVTETVFENRFSHVDELKRMGASIKVEDRSALIKGVTQLTGAAVKAADLRAGAALVIAGLVASGVTQVTGVHHINRGYGDLASKLRALGADIQGEASP
ncbi:MAG TPA: UDP-N-acetylglucosamine 1-carboxyvinyltransferase [Firmicutes bacterium]|nr:UDP-N-acetylglucosamine 1-carboxyvinyltransferase [Bacillota bacterium]